MSDAQKLILEALRKSLPPFDGFDHACAVAAAEVDKALGKLTRVRSVVCVFPDVEGELKSRFVSGWTVTE